MLKTLYLEATAGHVCNFLSQLKETMQDNFHLVAINNNGILSSDNVWISELKYQNDTNTLPQHFQNQHFEIC